MANLIDPIIFGPYTASYLIQAGASLVMLILYAWFVRGHWRTASPWNRIHQLTMICVSLTIINTLQQIANGALTPPECHTMLLLGGAEFWFAQGIMMTIFSLRLSQMNALGDPIDHAVDRGLRYASAALAVTLPAWHGVSVVPFIYPQTGTCTFRFTDRFAFAIVAHAVPVVLDSVVVARFYRYLDIALCRSTTAVTEAGRAKSRFFTIVFAIFVLQSLQAALTFAVLVDAIPLPPDAKPSVATLRHLLCNARLTLPLLVVQVEHRCKRRSVSSLHCITTN